MMVRGTAVVNGGFAIAAGAERMEIKTAVFPGVR
jgi:hypothetical protein